MTSSSADHHDPRSSSAVHAGLLEAITYELIPTKRATDKIVGLAPSSTVSVTASPVKGPEATVALAEALAEAGHHIIPHLSARTFPDRATLVQVIDHYRRLGVDEVFVVAGDATEAAGPWFDAIELLTDLVAIAPDLRRIGFTAYPDGHSFITHQALGEAMDAKAGILHEAGIAGYVSTQMCFSPDKIRSWLSERRDAGFTLPVKLGVPGAVERTKLITMGVRLGVGASLRYLKKNRGVFGSLLGSRYDPTELIAELVPGADALGIEGIHCFTFNQVESTVAWHRRAFSELTIRS